MYLIIIYIIIYIYYIYICFLFRQSGMTLNIAAKWFRNLHLKSASYGELHRLSKALFDVSGLNCHAPGSSLLAGGY